MPYRITQDQTSTNHRHCLNALGVRTLIVLLILAGGVFSGCSHTATTSQSPYAMVDVYLSYMTPAEKRTWCRNVIDQGLDATVRQAQVPESFWYRRLNIYGIKTPRGSMTPEQYGVYMRECNEVTQKLRDYANMFPPPPTITDRKAVE